MRCQRDDQVETKLLLRCRCLSFLVPGTAHDITECVVALVAGIFIDRLSGGRPRHFAAPRLIPGLRIVDGETIKKRMRVQALYAFHNVEILGRSAKASLVVK